MVQTTHNRFSFQCKLAINNNTCHNTQTNKFISLLCILLGCPSQVTVTVTMRTGDQLACFVSIKTVKTIVSSNRQPGLFN